MPASLQLTSLIGLILYFGVLLLIVTKEAKNHTVLDYFFANRRLPFWMLSLTFIASWWGAGSALSTADLAFAEGLGAYWCYGVPVLISTSLMILLAKKIRSQGSLTQGELFSVHYSSGAGRYLSWLILVFMIFTAASQMVGIGLFFSTYLEISYVSAVLLGTLIVLIYSLFGGFRGVVMTDIFQFVLLLISAMIVFVVAFTQAGGITGILHSPVVQAHPEMLSLGAGASKYMMFVITFGCAWMIQANVWQRISAARSAQDAHRMTVMSLVIYIPLYLLVVLTGLAGAVLYPVLPSGGVIPAIVTDYLDPITAACVFVGIAAAIMSTMDSLINTGALTLVVDIRSSSGRHSRRIRESQFATLIVTALALLIALRIQSILEISWIASDIITTGIFVPMMMIFTPLKRTSTSAIASMVVGSLYCAYNLLIFLGVNLPHFWESQSAQQVLLGIALSLIAYWLSGESANRSQDKQEEPAVPSKQ